MTLSTPSTLKQRAADALTPHEGNAKRLILLHTGVVITLNFLVLLITFLLDRGIESTGGLSGIQARSILTTAQFMLQLATFVFLPFWQISWVYITLRFTRGECAATADFWKGFRIFRPVIRLTILKALIFAGLIIAGVYAAYFIILATPMAAPLAEAMVSTNDPEAMSVAIMDAMAQIELPLILMGGGISLLLCAPFFYRFRVAEYFLLDHPELGARVALRASRQLMRGNGWRMVKLDLSFWWFWLLSALVTAVAYADVLLPTFGIQLPLSADIAFFVAYLVSIPLQLLLYRSCKVQVDSTYAAAYLSLIPPEQPPVTVAFPVNPQ